VTQSVVGGGTVVSELQEPSTEAAEMPSVLSSVSLASAEVPPVGENESLEPASPVIPLRRKSSRMGADKENSHRPSLTVRKGSGNLGIKGPGQVRFEADVMKDLVATQDRQE
jgi:hypothetical protein